jgi:hypothetical protein
MTKLKITTGTVSLKPIIKSKTIVKMMNDSNTIVENVPGWVNFFIGICFERFVGYQR